MNKRPSRGPFGLALSLLLLSIAKPAAAATKVEQSVVFKYPTTESKQQFLWNIDAERFRLEVRNGAETRFFVFNGRVFYVCGKLDEVVIASLQKDQVGGGTGALPAAMLTVLKNGACQELPSDFALRFLVNPYEALGNIDVTGGMSTNLFVPELTSGAAKEYSQPIEKSGSKCTALLRRYVLKDRSLGEYVRNVDAEHCVTSTIEWRKGLDRQVRMALVRVPGGATVYQLVASDLIKWPGLDARSKGEIRGKDAKGTDIALSYSVETTSAQVTELAKGDVSSPAGFEIIEPRGINTYGSVQQKTNISDTTLKSSEPASVPTLVKWILLGSNPAALLYGAGAAAAASAVDPKPSNTP